MKTEVLDDFADLLSWITVASGQAPLKISQDRGPRGKAMRLDFDFKGGGGFVVARKLFSFTLPEAYAFSFNLRGSAPPNKFEFKLVDPSNQNVWRYQQEAFDFASEWQTLRIKSSQIEFAWGPAGGGSMAQVGAIEFAISAGPGGKGTVWIADLHFEDHSFRLLPVVKASSALPDHEPKCAVDRSPATSWRSEPSAQPQWFLIDFQEERDYGGLIVQWEPTTRARAFTVQTSTDGAAWTTVYSADQAAGEYSYLYLPNSTSRYLRLNLHKGIDGQGFGIVAIEVKPYDFSRSLNAFFQSIAKQEPKGFYPKYLYGEQTYWSPIGIPESITRGLLNEEGMLEVDEGTFSIEPFLYVDGKLITWADASLTQALERDYLPIPTSIWQIDGIVLKTTAFATGDPGKSVLYVRYHIENTGDNPRQLGFFAALRPFQVTPPWQSFNKLGGVSPIRELDYRTGVVWVNRSKAVIPLTVPKQFGAAAFDQSAITTYLKTGGLPPQTQVSDDFGYASGALGYDLNLPAGAAEELYLAIPFGSSADLTPGELAGLLPKGVGGAEQFETAVGEWETKLGRVDIRLPPSARSATDTLKTAAAHILINRDGAALQPGPRRYTRCWIRDGAIMAAALLRIGCTHEMRDFIHWYAQYQAADGHIPCCVDRNGPDWLPEYDSLGEFIYTIMEYYRFTKDRGLLAEMWPAVVKTVECLEKLRNTRLTAEFQTPEKQACYGLLPESASHEGYLAHPVHAYWDDFWALRGLKDATAMAEILGDQIQALRLTGLRDAFQETLYKSIQTIIGERHLDYLPGSVEWADFDPTATANAIALLGELPNLPEEVVKRTFAQYLTGFREKHTGQREWSNYTPYEIRIIGALVRLGERQNAHELLNFFLSDRRPLPWNQWPEIAWRDPKTPGHLGDVPHTWIGAEYILAFRSMLAFESETDQALVIGAGLSEEWLNAAGGVAVERLPTWYGNLSFTLQRTETGALHVELSGDLVLPPGRIILQPPGEKPLQAVLVNGKPTLNFTSAQAIIEAFPAEVVLSY
jgi:hypothetical protein